MANKYFQSRVKHKRDTSANWTANNPVLLNGEIIIVDTEIGEVRTKTGDGLKTYKQLPFDDEKIKNLISDKISIQQGSENAGKSLIVNNEGSLVLSKMFLGSISQIDQLPIDSEVGTMCVLKNSIYDGVFYTGKLSDYFYGGDIFGTGWICIAGLNTDKFTPPEECIGWYGTSGNDNYNSVCVYKLDGTKAGEIWISPPEYPISFEVSKLGVESIDDTASFYLGYWHGDTDRFSNNLNILYNTWDILIWDGSQWCLCQSSSNHISNYSNPHNVTKEQIGLQHVSNYTSGYNTSSISNGFAGGYNAKTDDGGSIGYGSVSGSGFSGGRDAKVSNVSGNMGNYIDAIQLGTGTNETPKTLQVYNHQLMDANGKIPVERLPVYGNDLWGGNISDWSQIPAAPAPGTYCYVENDISNGVMYTGTVAELFSFDGQSFVFPYTDTILFTPNEECLGDTSYSETQKEVYIYNGSGTFVGSVLINPEMFPNGFDVSKLGASSVNDTVTFYLGIYDGEQFPNRIYDFKSGSLIIWDGLSWRTVSPLDIHTKIPNEQLHMEVLAPYTEQTGSTVSCCPVDGGAFDVVSHVTLKQGEGTPSFENPLPISGFDSITLTANGTEFSVNLGQTVYGGTFDWNSGTLTVTYTKEVLDGTRTYSRHSPWDSTDTYCFYVPLKKVGKRPIYESGVCDKLPNIGSESNREGFLSTNNRKFLYIKIFKEKLFNEPTGDNLKAYLSENPIEFCYDIEPAEIVSLTSQEIEAIAGENVFSSDCGETTVKCNEQVTAVINRLSERIAQLESAAAGI